MKRLVAMCLLLFCPYLAQCQDPNTYEGPEPAVDSEESTEQTKKESTRRETRLKITAGYFGETMAHPGVVLGIEHCPYGNGRYQFLWGTNIGGYVHARNNTTIFIREQWGQRITYKSGLFVDHFIGLGYLHHFASGGEIFDVLPNGAVVNIPNSGRSMIMPSVAVGTGYNIKRSTGIDLQVYIRPELFWKAPFNGYYLTHFALNAGFLFNLNSK
ncbi:MAG: hypothetical protein JNM41_12775 [Flavipsychrobacter sp.]|nr:hypothetical protein [Flavipsychrobacter sp.]